MDKSEINIGPSHPLREQQEAHMETIAREVRGMFACAGGGQGGRFRGASVGEDTVLLYSVTAVELPKLVALRAMNAGKTAADILAIHEGVVAGGAVAAKVAPPPRYTRSSGRRARVFPSPVACGERRVVITIKISVEEQQSRDGGELHDLARKILCGIVEAQAIGQPLVDAIAAVLEDNGRGDEADTKLNDALDAAISALEDAKR